MKILKVIGNCCCVFLVLIGVLVSIAYGYYHFFVKDKTVGVNNVSDQLGVDLIQKAEDLTEEEINIYEERWFMEANYYSNANQNGIQLQELNFNYFTNYNLTSKEYRSTGMQFVGDYKHHDVTVSSKSERDNYVFKDFYYYDTTDGVSFNGYYGNNASVNVLLKRSTSFTIKIDNRAFEIQLDKYWSKKHGWWIFGYTEYHYYTYSELFESVMNAIESNSAGFGDYYITLDLSDFFTIREYDSNGKLKTDDVTDIIKNYAVLKFHYDENGAINSNQSLFNCISCNPSYNSSSEQIDTTYWQERVVYCLQDNIFDYRHSETYKGYFISLSMDKKKIFNEMPRTKVNVLIDLESICLQEKNINIVGIDYNGFENIEINTLTIKGNNQIFYLLDNSLHNTQLQILEHSASIKLDISQSAINSEYVEVEL